MLVKEKDSLHLCVDYHQLNAKTTWDAFPLPRIEESLDALTGACWFSTMDLASGYNQVPVTEGDQPKTAFCTPFGLFKWNRMPFGIWVVQCPLHLPAIHREVILDQQCQSFLLYLDDIVVFFTSNTQHLEWEGLKARLEKCAFLQQEVRYLGHVISSRGVATDPSKIEAVAQWPRPSSVTQLRSFLGFSSYYRRFVEGFSKLFSKFLSKG